MPGKSRTRKEKKVFRPAAGSQPITNAIPPAVTVSVGTGSGPVKAVPMNASTNTAAKTAAAASSYIGRELVTITFTTGVMLIIVIAVSLLLR